MTQYTTPIGGTLSWVYQPFTYNGGVTVREVTSRSMNDAAASLTNSWTFSHPSSDSGLTYHSSTDLLDGGALSHKVYGPGIPLSGTSLVVPVSYQEENPGGVTVLMQKSFTWTQDSAGNAYVGTVTSTLSPGTGNAVTSKTVQTLDTYGNLIQQQLYDYPNNPAHSDPTSPFRTYNFTYLTDSNYTSRYIRNRLTLATATGYGGTVYLATTTYDGTTLGALLDPSVYNGTLLPCCQPTPILHDSTYGTGLTYRGNPTSSWQFGTTTNSAYLTTGVPYKMQDGAGMTVTVTTDGSTAYSLPSVLTPNSNGNLATSMTYSASFTLSSVTGTNGATQSVVYDAFKRPGSVTSVDGAVTGYSYTYLPNTQTATVSTTVNGTTTTQPQWKRTTFDGFGRTMRVETGHDAVTVSATDTRYGPCGCSPLGKMTAVSMPYAPGATVYWTTYTYDGSGRTLTETKPDGSATTTSYAGNTVTTTDPAWKWKTYYSDSAGGLTTVIEPDPNNASPSSNPVTYYYLNGAGQTAYASVLRNGVSQNRSYTWGGTDLVSSTEPETGTTTYSYDGNHHVTRRTDAKAQQTRYYYDAYERLTEVRYYAFVIPCNGCGLQFEELTNQRVDYAYDGNPIDGSYSEYSWGRLTAATFQLQSGSGNQFAYLYTYNQAGRVTGNRLMATDGGSNLLVDLKAVYTWDNQGRMTNMTYPSGPALAYQYDAMSRLSGITQNGSAIATAGYTPVGQLSTLQYSSLYESRTYNNLMQLTHLTNVGVDMQYLYAAGQNNGRVSQTIDGVLGETVNYQYDMWNRVTNATATNGSWGEQFTFDGFGNLTGKTPTAGSAPSLSVGYDPTTNRPTGASFDPNGNPTPGSNNNQSYPGYTWDVENRLVASAFANADQPINYGYDPWGRRMWKDVPAPGTYTDSGEIYFYGATGQKLETYSFTNGTSFGYSLEGINIYFGGKLLQSKGVWVATDRLGSVRANSNGERMSYFPYGEERTSTADGREKFGTYTRDGIGQDYAGARYFSANGGAFWTPDPSGIKTANAADPTSWNRYAYVSGDPVNFIDPDGRFLCNPDVCKSEAPIKLCSEGSDDPLCTNKGPTTGTGPGTTTQQGGGGAAGGAFLAAQNLFQRLAKSVAKDKFGKKACQADFADLGTNTAAVDAGAAGAVFLNGVNSGVAMSTLYASAPNPSLAAAAASVTGTVGSYISANPGTVAIAQLGGSNIFLNGGMINTGPGQYFQNISIVLHEVLHNITGLTDGDIQSALGIQVTPNSDNITQRLKKDCF